MTRGVHLNYFRKYTPPVRETNCIPLRDRSACNYATSHNLGLLPRGSIVSVALYSPSLRRPTPTRCRRSDFSIFLDRTRLANLSLYANDLTLPVRSRGTRGAPFPRRDILRAFSARRTRATQRGRHCPRSPMCSFLSAVLQGSSMLSGALQLAPRRQIIEVLTEVSVILSPRIADFSLTLFLRTV